MVGTSLTLLCPPYYFSTQPEKFRRQRQALEAAEIQGLAAFRDIREQHLDIGMLAVEGGAALVFRVHDPLDRRKVALAQRIVLIAEQAPSCSLVFDGFDPDVHHLA